MKAFNQTIIETYGETGRIWLNHLPDIIKKLTLYWNLSNLVPFDNLSYNYVVKACKQQNHPVVIKISCDLASINAEKRALEYFDGYGCIKYLDFNDQYNALLLQQAIPGFLLKSCPTDEFEIILNCYVAVVKKLHTKRFSAQCNFPSISDWLIALDKAASDKIPAHLLNKAINLKNKLLTSLGQIKLLHGDLHLENILKNDDQWLAIDPKGVYGEAEFEIAAFDFTRSTDSEVEAEIKKMFADRIHAMAQKSGYDYQRIKDWVFVRLVLSAVWSIEDNGDPTRALKLAECLY